jgi:cytochrome c556
MDGQIDPSADAIWDSVAFIATTTGTEDRQPRTDEEWKAVRTSAITLSEAANLLSMPGRSVAASKNHSAGQPAAGMLPAAESQSDQHQAADSQSGEPVGLGELPPAQIQQRIDADHASFAQFARILQDAALKALAAIDAKDPQGLMDAGGVIDQACEACHMTYWYPNQARPGS